MYFSDWRRLQQNKDMFYIFSSFVAEGISKEHFEKIVHNFLPFLKKELKIRQLPHIHFIEDPRFAQRIGAFGEINKKNRIVIDIKNRQTMDILRTVAHELVHYQQHERGIKGSGNVGSYTENKANQIAGIILRKFGEKHSDLFLLSPVNEAKKRKKRNELIDIDSDHYPMELS